MDSERSYVVTANLVRALPDSFGRLILGEGRRIVLQSRYRAVAASAELGPLLGWGNQAVVTEDGNSVEVYTGDIVSVHRLKLTDNSVFFDSFD